MKQVLCGMLFLIVSFPLFAQKEEAPVHKWSKKYIHLGVNLPEGDLGQAPLTSQSVEQNILSGRYGTKLGFLFESGHRYYFNGSDYALRFGLDWTIIHFTYNEMDWDEYTGARGGLAYSKKMFGFASRLGPVISFRPVSKLQIDFRAQIAPTLQISGFYYQPTDDSTQFSLLNDRILHSFGWKGNLGLGVHWGFIGLAVDYSIGKINTQYSTSTDDNGDAIILQKKIQANFLEAKLSLNF